MSENHIDQLLSLKIAMIFIMIVIIYIGMIPAFSSRCRKSEHALSLMNCFAGGVFLAMALVHTLPEAAEGYNTYMLEQYSLDSAARVLQAVVANATLADG